MLEFFLPFTDEIRLDFVYFTTYNASRMFYITALVSSASEHVKHKRKATKDFWSKLHPDDEDTPKAELILTLKDKNCRLLDGGGPSP